MGYWRMLLGFVELGLTKCVMGETYGAAVICEGKTEKQAVMRRKARVFIELTRWWWSWRRVEQLGLGIDSERVTREVGDCVESVAAEGDKYCIY